MVRSIATIGYSSKPVRRLASPAGPIVALANKSRKWAIADIFRRRMALSIAGVSPTKSTLLLIGLVRRLNQLPPMQQSNFVIGRARTSGWFSTRRVTKRTV
jgi:hypothetical protein